VKSQIHFVKLNVPASSLRLLKGFHKQFVNVDSPSNSEISEYFWDHEGNFRFSKSKDPIIDEHFDLIIHTGIIL
jgi:hypothetical protein